MGADIEFGRRAAEETNRLFEGPGEAAKRLRVSRKVIYSWENGTAPSTMSLARLHYCGGDVLYILTGRRSREHVCGCCPKYSQLKDRA